MSPNQWLPILFGALVATSANAEPLTFSHALDRAAANAPSLQARKLQVDAARAERRSAGVLPDPRLTAGIDNFPVSGPMAGRFGADEMTMARVGVMQDVPNGAQRRAERLRASAEVGVAQARVEMDTRTVRVAAALAWIDLHYAERRLSALDDVMKALRPLWEAQPSGVTSGALRPAAALAPVRLRADLEDKRSELVAAVARARAELTRWTDDPSPSVVGAAPAPRIEAAILRAGLDRHPNLLAYRSAADRAGAEVDLARAAKRPDWGWEVSYGRRDPMFGDMVSAGVTVRLPLFPGRRQDPIIVARRADALRVGAEREDAHRMLATALEADLADHVMHHERWIRARDTLLPTAQSQADLETASYAAGTAGLSEVLEAFTLFADARLTALDREAVVARDAVRIVLTYGSDQS